MKLHRRQILDLFLLAVFLFQAISLWDDYAGPWLLGVAKTWDSSRQERAEFFMHWVKDDHRRLLRSVRDHVPLSASVMIPPTGDDFVLSDKALMQFLLYPREIVRCSPAVMGGAQGCFEYATERSIPMITTETFPGDIEATDQVEYLYSTSTYGVLFSGSSPVGSGE